MGRADPAVTPFCDATFTRDVRRRPGPWWTGLDASISITGLLESVDCTKERHWLPPYATGFSSTGHQKRWSPAVNGGAYGAVPSSAVLCQAAPRPAPPPKHSPAAPAP